MDALFLAIDQGGQSTRVGVFNGEGDCLCVFSSPCETHSSRHSQGVFIEQDPQEIVDGISRCIEEVARYLGDDVSRLVAAGYAGQGSSLLAWDSITGAPLTPVISWQDVRGAAYLSTLSSLDIPHLTGLRPSAHYGATKFSWCLDHVEPVQQAAASHRLAMGPVVTFVLNRLTNQLPPIDPGHAQRTLLWNRWKNNWDTNLLSVMGLSTSMFPSCSLHLADYGHLIVGNAKVPVKVCARDQGASLFSQGWPDDEALYINMGTGIFIQRIHHDEHVPEGMLIAPLWVSESSVIHALEATVNGAASALKAVSNAAGVEVTPEVMDKALAIMLRDNVWCLNAEGGLGAPYWRTDVLTQYAPNLTALEKVAAWLESLLFLIAINIHRLPVATPIQCIYVSGGFSRSDALCQRLATLTGRVVIRRKNSDATLRGIAYLASGFSKSWKVEEQDARFLPEVSNRIFNRFEQWKAAMQAWLNGS